MFLYVMNCIGLDIESEEIDEPELEAELELDLIYPMEEFWDILVAESEYKKYADYHKYKYVSKSKYVERQFVYSRLSI